MARYLKIAALAIGAVLLVLLAAGIWFGATVNPNDYKGDLVRLMQQQHQRTLAIPGNIKLRLYPRIGAEFGKVSLSEQNSADEFASADGVTVSVGLLALLRNRIEIDRVEVRGARLNLVRREDGSVNTSDPTAARTARHEAGGIARGGASMRFAVDSIRIDNARLLVDDRKTGRKLEVSHLNIESGAVARGVPGRLALSGNLSMNKPALNMAITFRSAFMPDAARRRIAFTDLEANFDIASNSARIAASGRLDVDLDVDEFAADLKGSLDDSVFELKAGRRVGEYQLAFHIDKLDLNRFNPAPAGAAPDGTPVPIDFSSLANLHASGSIHIDALTTGQLSAANVRAVLRADGTKLALEPTAADLYGGTAAGALSFDFSRSAATPRISLAQNLKGVQVGPLLRAALGRDTIDGTGELLIDVQTEGASLAAMRQALGGRAGLRVENGTLAGIDLPAKAALAARPDTREGLAASEEKTAFARLAASFAIANGIAHNEGLLLEAGLLRVTGSGDIDLGAEQIDFRLACKLSGTEIALPLRLSGPWSAIRWQVDTRTVTAAAVRKQAGEQLKAAIKSMIRQRDKMKKKPAR